MIATRADTLDLGTFFVWSTANFHYSSFATGALGPILFGLGWWDSFATIVFFNFLGDIPPSIISYMGPRLGMRSMIITRYSFGYWASKVIVLLNAVTCIGVSASRKGYHSNLLMMTCSGLLSILLQALVFFMMRLTLSSLWSSPSLSCLWCECIFPIIPCLSGRRR
jgi:purine-cytosine permease-like protein